MKVVGSHGVDGSEIRRANQLRLVKISRLFMTEAPAPQVVGNGISERINSMTESRP